MDNPPQFSSQDLSRFFLLLVSFEIVLLAVYFLDMLLGSPVWFFQRLVNIDGENSIAAWFSSMQLFLIGVLLFLWGWRHRPGPGPNRWFIMLGAGGFFFLSADEALFIHESITEALLKYEWLFRFEGGHGIWIPIYLSILVVLIALSWRQFWRFWNHHRRTFLLMAAGAGTFLFGAVGLEVASYEFIPDDSALYLVEVAAEEFLEMLGANIILYASMEVVTEPERSPVARPVVLVQQQVGW